MACAAPEVAVETAPPAAAVVFWTAWAAVSVTEEGVVGVDGVAGGVTAGDDGVGASDGDGVLDPCADSLDGAAADPSGRLEGDDGGAGVGVGVVRGRDAPGEDDVGVRRDVGTCPRAATRLAVARRVPEARAALTATAWRTGTAGNVVTAASSPERSAAPSRGAAASSVARPPGWSSGSRMFGQPWKARPAERIASRIPPAAITDPDAPTTPAKARKKRIRGRHR
jgi:hypothetical protein